MQRVPYIGFTGKCTWVVTLVPRNRFCKAQGCFGYSVPVVKKSTSWLSALHSYTEVVISSVVFASGA